MADESRSFLAELEEEEQEWLATLEEGEEVEVKSQAEVDARADYYLELLAQVEAEMARNEEVGRARIQKVEDWLAGENMKLQRRIEHLRFKLEALVQGYDYGTKKSRSLPHGTFGYRARPPRAEIVDMDAAVAWARQRGLEVKESVRVNATTLKKHIKTSGEIPDNDAGFLFVEPDPEFFVKPEGA